MAFEKRGHHELRLSGGFIKPDDMAVITTMALRGYSPENTHGIGIRGTVAGSTPGAVLLLALALTS
jgi:hypothetical protein